MARTMIEAGGRRRKGVFLKLVVCTGIIVALSLIYIYLALSKPISRETQPIYGPSTKIEYNWQEVSGNYLWQELSGNSSVQPLACEVHRVVFLKTHKTGSTTAASIFQRFGMKRNLTFLVPDHRHILSERNTFNTLEIGQPTSKSWNFSIGYQMLTNHIRYNRSEMNKVFHNTTYVTILRNPVAQFESGFFYFKMDRFLPKSEDPFELFMSNPMKYYNYIQQKFPGKENRLHNMQLYDLGMNPMDMYRMDVIDEYIQQLEKDFNFIMINEYFDESLVLLRKLLCWKMTDITYMSRTIRSAKLKRNMTDELRAKVLQWNSGDAKLYDYFNRTFWEKVRNYDGDFEADLELFKKQQEFVQKCITTGNQSKSKDDRTVSFTLVKNAPKWCHDYRTSDISSSEKTCTRMRSLGIPQYQTGFHKSSKTTRKVIVKKEKSFSPGSKYPDLKIPDTIKAIHGEKNTNTTHSTVKSNPAKYSATINVKTTRTIKENTNISEQHLTEDAKNILETNPTDVKKPTLPRKKKVIIVKRVTRPKSLKRK